MYRKEWMASALVGDRNPPGLNWPEIMSPAAQGVHQRRQGWSRHRRQSPSAQPSRTPTAACSRRLAGPHFLCPGLRRRQMGRR